MESATEHQGRILLVDDESAILRTFRYCLEDEGYSVATATSAAQAEALLQRQVFDLCFLDLRLGEDNGLDVLAQMRIQAPWMSALAHVDQKSWGDASPKFTRAMTCFTSTAATAREDLSRVESSNRTPAQKARQIATLTNRVETAEERSAQSAFNAAQCYALLGNKSMALTHVDVALAYPKMREKAQALKAAIEKLP